MTVLVEEMPWQRTAAFSLSLRGGVNAESTSMSGLASTVCEMVQRGAGSMNSRDLVAMQDNLGIERSSNVVTEQTFFAAAMPAESLQPGLQLYADVARDPHLPIDQLDDAKMMAIQELRAMEDEPTYRLMRELRRRQFGPLLGRSSTGTVEGVEAVTQEAVREYFTDHYHAGEAILAVAGKVDSEQVFDWVEAAFGDWKANPVEPLPTPQSTPGYQHIESSSVQTHIGFAFPIVPFGHSDYFRMRAGIGILSDGMSSRLFDRVREQRGLCYTISAGTQSLPHCGTVIGYAGTTPERAQETLDVTMAEIHSFANDLSNAELDRWKVRIESSLIMENESSGSRAGSLSSDHYQTGRVIPTAELEQEIESLTVESVCDYWKEHPAGDMVVVTLGQEALTV